MSRTRRLLLCPLTSTGDTLFMRRSITLAFALTTLLGSQAALADMSGVFLCKPTTGPRSCDGLPINQVAVTSYYEEPDAAGGCLGDTFEFCSDGQALSSGACSVYFDACPSLMQPANRSAPIPPPSSQAFTCTLSESQQLGIPMGNSSQCPYTGPIITYAPPPIQLVVSIASASDSPAWDGTDTLKFDGSQYVFTCYWGDMSQHGFGLSFFTTQGSGMATFQPAGGTALFGSGGPYQATQDSGPIIGGTADCTLVKPGQKISATYLVNPDPRNPQTITLVLTKALH